MTLQKIGLIFLLLKKESLLDHIYLNKLKTISRVNFSTPTFGDHLPVMIELSNTVDKVENVIQTSNDIIAWNVRILKVFFFGPLC